MDQEGHSIHDTRAEPMILMMAESKRTLQTLTKYFWQTTMLSFLLVIGGCATFEHCKETGGLVVEVASLSVTPNGEILAGGRYYELDCVNVFAHLGPSSAKGLFLATSSDRGKSWKARRIPFTIPEAYPSGFDLGGLAASKGGTLYAGINHRTFLRTWEYVSKGFESHARLLKSDDGGITWKQAYDFGDDYLRQIVATSNSVLLAALSRQGIMRSKDNGETWTNADLRALDLISNGSGEIYTDAWGRNGPGYYRSTDDGLTWSRLPIPTPGQNSAKIAANDNGIVVVSHSLWPFQGEEMYRSDDHGKTWKPVTPPSGALTELLGVAADGTIFINRSYGLISQGGSYISTDGGESWVRVSNLWTKTNEIPIMDSIVTGPSGVLFGGDGLRSYKRASSWHWGGIIYYSEDSGRSWHLITPLLERIQE